MGIKRMSAKEFRAEGYLQELNRKFLHPLGLALEVIVDEESGEEYFGEVHDYRGERGGIIFSGDVVNSERFVGNMVKVWREQMRSHEERIDELGYVVQMPDPDLIEGALDSG